MLNSFFTGDVVFGNHLPIVLIAGPCAMEEESLNIDTAGKLKEICKSLGISLIYKSSFDKANRTNISSARGLGLEKSKEIFNKIKQEFQIPCLTDIHTPEQVDLIGNSVDILQIPAFLCRQTDLLVAAGKSGLAVNIKKGQFLSPQEMKFAISKIESQNNKRILLTERGSCFGYNNLVVDMRSLVIMAEYNYPVVMDATHAVQLPGTASTGGSGGDRRFAPILARAAAAVGVAAVFLETHPNPEKAISDADNMIPLGSLEEVMKPIVELDYIIKKYPKTTF